MKQKTVFYCTECGNETARWSGQCPACGAWNTLTEAPTRPKNENKAAAAAHRARQTPEKLSDLDAEEEIRFTTGVGELDRVLGGGAVRGQRPHYGDGVCGKDAGTPGAVQAGGPEIGLCLL